MRKKFDEAKRDKLKRDDIVAEAERRIELLKQEKQDQHTKRTCELRSHAVFGKYVYGTVEIPKG